MHNWNWYLRRKKNNVGKNYEENMAKIFIKSKI